MLPQDIIGEDKHTMTSANRIAKNTIALYFRQILIMLVSLYTVRVVLATLGAEDYGIYNIVAGVVTMFGFLSGAMATASQRYFSFEMGKENTGESEQMVMTSSITTVNDINNTGLLRIFSVTFTIYALMALIIIVLAETLGLWFVNAKLVIPENRMLAANVVYQCAVFSFLFTVMTTPYMSSIIAHENMNVYAYVSIVEAFLKLVIVLVLKIGKTDKLILYGILLLCVAIINTGLYRLYCKRHYDECRFRLLWDGKLFREMASYVGWNTFGSAVGVFKNQIVNILLNQFFGAVVNAARAVASQVSSAVVSFSQNFSTAIRPQIIKTYAADEKDECERLVFRGCKMTFLLMYVFTLPLVLEMPFVLKIWLVNPPENASLFACLVLLDALVDSVSYPIMTLAQATGKIKLYQGVVGGILLLNLPVSYICLRLGCRAWSVLAVAIAITFVAFIVRLFIVRHLAEFSIRKFITKVCFPIFLVAVLSAVVPFVAETFLKNEILRFFVVVILSVGLTVLCVLFVGMSKAERSSLFDAVTRRIKHVS